MELNSRYLSSSMFYLHYINVYGRNSHNYMTNNECENEEKSIQGFNNLIVFFSTNISFFLSIKRYFC